MNELRDFCLKYNQELEALNYDENSFIYLKNTVAYFRLEIIFLRILMTELCERTLIKKSIESLAGMIPQAMQRIQAQTTSSLYKCLSMSSSLRYGMDAYIQYRIQLNDPLKYTVLFLDELIKNFYYLHRLLQSDQSELQKGIIKGEVKINHSDTIAFYESLSGKQDMFPSMVGKIKELERENEKLESLAGSSQNLYNPED